MTAVQTFLLSALLSILPLSGFGAAAPEQDELAALEQRRLLLLEQASRLAEEQQLLRFRAVMQGVDSKYVLLDAAGKSGRLMYKNRILLDFKFIPAKSFLNGRQPGKMLTLSRKTEGKGGRHALVFGNALILQWKRRNVPPQEADIPFISLTKKDLLSVYNALEDGAQLFVSR